VRLIEAGLKPGDSFLDIGTGSGILMVVAGKLGAGRMCGVDRDELAVRIASENLGRNGIGAERFDLVQGSLAAPVQGRFDVVAANILTHVVLELLGDVPRVLKPGGIFICSGIIAENKDLVVGRMTAMDFDVLDARLQEGWVAIAGRYK
jgi:ribosomal protein L11 methyltransferase